jgi:hypothetical protein
VEPDGAARCPGCVQRGGIVCGGVGEQAFQYAGAARSGTNDGCPDALRYFHGIQSTG